LSVQSSTTVGFRARPPPLSTSSREVLLNLSRRCILGDVRLWVVDPSSRRVEGLSTSSCPVSLPHLSLPSTVLLSWDLDSVLWSGICQRFSQPLEAAKTAALRGLPAVFGVTNTPPLSGQLLGSRRRLSPSIGELVVGLMLSVLALKSRLLLPPHSVRVACCSLLAARVARVCLLRLQGYLVLKRKRPPRTLQ